MLWFKLFAKSLLIIPNLSVVSDRFKYRLELTESKFLSRLMIFKSYALILTLFKQYFPMTPSLFHSSMLTHIREYEVLQAQTKHMPNKHFPMRVRIL